MINRLERGELTTDLDAKLHDLFNVGELVPVPLNLVETTDPRLSDARAPLPGSVTDESVAEDAGIVQSKLNLNGSIPPAWLGTESDQAAPGNLAEYILNKAQPGGYASLDGTGKVPVAQLPLGAGTGTLTSIGLTMPSHFSVTGSPVTSSGTIVVAWNSVAGGSWFGNATGGPAQPAFNTVALPVSLIPDLDASDITSGIFVPARLPLAVGVGVSHAPGIVPDPGATGDVFDYLARDMTYRAVPAFGAPAYQPRVPDPIITVNVTPPYIVTITSPLEEVALFYSVGSPSSGFTPVVVGEDIILANGQTVWVYGAKAGYSNSNVISASAPSAPPNEPVTVNGVGEVVTGDDLLTVTVGP